jgi:hypothetical protein
MGKIHTLRLLQGQGVIIVQIHFYVDLDSFGCVRGICK